MSLSITPRWLISYVGALIAGGLGALMFAFALINAQSIFILLAYFAAVPLFVAGLGGGSIAGFIAGISGTATLLLTNNPALPILFFLLNALPIMVLIPLALRHRADAEGNIYWYPEGLLLTVITLYPCIAFITGVVATMSQDGGLLGATTHMLNASFAPIKAQASPDARLALGSLIDQTARYLPAMFGFCWIFITYSCLIIAQRVLTRLRWNRRSHFAMADIYVPAFLVYAMAATGLMAAFAPLFYSYIGINLCVMLGIPFFFAGLGIIHAWAETKVTRFFILALIYISFFMVWPLLLVTLLGVLDQWIHFRRRMVAGSPTTH